jgi:hypothetical protein
MIDLEALELLRSDIRKLFPPGPLQEKWLAWAECVAAVDSLHTRVFLVCGRSERSMGAIGPGAALETRDRPARERTFDGPLDFAIRLANRPGRT